MKIYIGNKTIEDDSYKSITEPQILNYLSEDSECTVIVLDRVLTKYSLNEIVNVLSLCHKKLRIGGTLKIVDLDFDLLTYIYKKLGDIVQLNNSVFENEMGSFITLELVSGIINSNFKDMENSFSKIQNVEFDLEFTRK